MSHPNPQYDYSDEHNEGDAHPVRKEFMDKNLFKSKMKEIRGGLQKVVGHKRRERHGKAKNEALKKKM